MRRMDVIIRLQECRGEIKFVSVYEGGSVGSLVHYYKVLTKYYHILQRAEKHGNERYNDHALKLVSSCFL